MQPLPDLSSTDRVQHKAPGRYRCTAEGCGKTFTRRGYLRRHSLNHSKSRFECHRCSACFTRTDLLDRHIRRHDLKDKSAGGNGLGLLGTKRKHLKRRGSPEYPRPASQAQGNSPEEDSLANNSNAQLLPSEHANLSSSLTQIAGIQPDISLSGNTDITSVSVFNSDHGMGHAEGFHGSGEIYHDLTFDHVHFNLTALEHYSIERVYLPEIGFSCQHRDLPRVQTYNERQLSSRTETDAVNAAVNNSGSDPHWDIGFDSPVSIFSLHGQEGSSGGIAATTSPGMEANSPHDPFLRLRQWNVCPLINRATHAAMLEIVAIIQPTNPDGTSITWSSSNLTLTSIQEYLQLFVEFFNTSYPMFHMPTFDTTHSDPVLLLSMVIMGATYKVKEAHQFSACLYNALIPYLFSDLLNDPCPDLKRLQSLLVLECYGMYRAGPHQREKALLLHGLTLTVKNLSSKPVYCAHFFSSPYEEFPVTRSGHASSCQRASRTKAKIGGNSPMLSNISGQSAPDITFHLTKLMRSYRLILFFFMFDIQNTSFFSLMPSLSLECIQVELPCSELAWNATSEAAWKLHFQHDSSPPTLATLVRNFLDPEHHSFTTSYGRLTLVLVLHGLMSMCNDILHFDNRSVYLRNPGDDCATIYPLSSQLSSALELWMMKWDMLSMSTATGFKSETVQFAHSSDSIAVLAIYHMAHIVINTDIRHLQIAAGAKSIFGHVVSPEDSVDSIRWLRSWVANSPEATFRASWHAAQIFREGMLNLDDWDVHDVFHYPWCLYIATLTCWAIYNFRPLTSASLASNPSSHIPLSDDWARVEMHQLVSTITAVMPVKMAKATDKIRPHGLMTVIATRLRNVRWTAAYEAMKVLQALTEKVGRVGDTLSEQGDGI